MGVVTTRRMDQLQAQCDQLGVPYLETDGRLELMDRLRQATGAFDSSLELDPMKAKDLKHDIAWGTEAPFAGIAKYLTSKYVAEPKLDGARLRMFIGKTGSSLNSGRRSVQTFRYTDRSANFPHLSEVGHTDLAGVILDGEILAPVAKLQTHTGTWTNSLLNSSVALCNSNPAGSQATQRRFGKAQFWVFDVLAAPGGESIQHLSYDDRRKVLELVVKIVQARFPECEVRLVPQLPAAVESITESIRLGFEGVMLKDRQGRYKPGKRGSEWLKVKTFSTADAYVCGFNPGENANEGLVGSLNLAVRREDGSEYPVAQVGNLTQKMREEISAADGSLKPEYYGVVIELMAQGLGKNGRARHAHMVRIRPDKGPEDCGEDQLEVFPRV